MDTLTLLNSSILTSYGSYNYEPLTLEKAKSIVQEFKNQNRPIQSAIGHQATAELLSILLDYPVQANRIEFKQTSADTVLVFKLKSRIPEGTILTREEIEAIGYEFGLLTKL